MNRRRGQNFRKIFLGEFCYIGTEGGTIYRQTQILAELNIRRNAMKYSSFRFVKYAAYTFVRSHGVKFILDLGRRRC